MELALGREIKKAREVLQQSQEALAFEAGIHRTYVSLIERGKKSPTLGGCPRINASSSLNPNLSCR